MTDQTVVFQAVVLEPIGVVIGDEDETIDEETIGIYTSHIEALAAIERYTAARMRDDVYLLSQFECVIHKIQLDKDLIYPRETQ